MSKLRDKIQIQDQDSEEVEIDWSYFNIFAHKF